MRFRIGRFFSNSTTLPRTVHQLVAFLCDFIFLLNRAFLDPFKIRSITSHTYSTWREIVWFWSMRWWCRLTRRSPKQKQIGCLRSRYVDHYGWLAKTTTIVALSSSILASSRRFVEAACLCVVVCLGLVMLRSFGFCERELTIYHKLILLTMKYIFGSLFFL